MLGCSDFVGAKIAQTAAIYRKLRSSPCAGLSYSRAIQRGALLTPISKMHWPGASTEQLSLDKQRRRLSTPSSRIRHSRHDAKADVSTGNNSRFGSDSEVNSAPHSWHGEMVHLWRAVDQAGRVFENFVTKDRDRPAAQTVIEKTKYVGGRNHRCRTGTSLDHVVRLERAVHVSLRLDLDGGMAD